MKQDPGPYIFKARIAAIFRREDSPCVYFIREGADGPIKIGVSNCGGLESRLTSLQIGNPRRLVFVGIACISASRTSAYNEEHRLHAHFAAFRLQGEWFESCPSLLALIEEFAYAKYGGELRQFLRSELLRRAVG